MSLPAVDEALGGEVSPPRSESGIMAALRTRDFRLLWIGQLTSEVGNGAIQLALPWLVLQLTGSAFQLGLAYFVQFLPMLLFGLVGGVFVDRWDRRMTIVVVDAIRSVAFMSVGVIYYLDALTPEYLYAVLFLESSLANFFNPARAALMPNLVPPENIRSANSIMEVSRHIGFLMPTAGAVMIGIFGAAALLFFDGVTFLISGIMVFFIAYRQPNREKPVPLGYAQSSFAVVDETITGLKRIMRTHLLRVAIFLGFALNMIVAPIQLLLPLFVRDVKGAAVEYFGLLVGALLVGLIIGALTAPAAARRFGLGKLTIVSIYGLGIIISIAVWPPSLWPPVAAMAIAGIAIGTLNVAQTTLLQQATTDEERGRVSATYYTSTLGMRPFAFLIVGTLASGIDVRFIFVFLGAMTLVLGLILNQSEEVRQTR